MVKLSVFIFSIIANIQLQQLAIGFFILLACVRQGYQQQISVRSCQYQGQQYIFSQQEYQTLRKCTNQQSQNGTCQNSMPVIQGQCVEQQQSSGQVSQVVFGSNQGYSCNQQLYIKCLTQQGSSSVSLNNFGLMAQGNAYCVATCGQSGYQIASAQLQQSYSQSYSTYTNQSGSSNVLQYSQNSYLVACSYNHIGYYECAQADGTAVPINAQNLSKIQQNCVGQSIGSACFDQNTLNLASTLSSGQCSYKCRDKQDFITTYGTQVSSQFVSSQTVRDYIQCQNGLSLQKVCTYSDNSMVLVGANSRCSMEQCLAARSSSAATISQQFCTDKCFQNIQTGQSLLQTPSQKSTGGDCCQVLREGELPPGSAPQLLIPEKVPTESHTPLANIPGISFFPNYIGPSLFAPNPNYLQQFSPTQDTIPDSFPNKESLNPTSFDIGSSPFYINQNSSKPTSIYLPSSEIRPDSYRTNPFGEPIFANSPTVLEVPEDQALNPLSAPLQQRTANSNRDVFLGNSNFSIPTDYKPLCQSANDSIYGCNLALITIPIKQSNYSIWIGAWEPCYGSCGSSVRFRSVICIDSLYMFPVDRKYCGSQIDYYSYDLVCNSQPCAQQYWLYQNYTGCLNPLNGVAVSCGGGIKRRNAICFTGNITNYSFIGPPCQGRACRNATYLAQLPEGCRNPPQDLEVPCNTSPCSTDVFVYEIGSWGTCTGNCSVSNVGQHNRKVSCFDLFNQTVDLIKCIGQPPATTENCTLQCPNSPIPSQATPQSSGKRRMLKQRKEMQQYERNGLELEGNEMRTLQQAQQGASGLVFDSLGNLCQQGKLDKCGVCGGNCQTFNITGQPCDLTLDQIGSCCESGDIVDGVCQGNAQLLAQNSNNVCTAEKVNGTDCPVLPQARCPLGNIDPQGALSLCSSHGRCLYLSARCDCFKGYIGEKCDQCAPNYYYDQSSKGCNPTNFQKPSYMQGNEAAQPAHLQFASKFDTPRKFKGVVVAIAFGAALLLASLIFILFWLVLAARRRKIQKKYNSKVKDFASMIDNKNQPRTYSGVFQSFTEKLAAPHDQNASESSHSQRDLLDSEAQQMGRQTSPLNSQAKELTGIQQQQTQSSFGAKSMQHLLDASSNSSSHFQKSDFIQKK